MNKPVSVKTKRYGDYSDADMALRERQNTGTSWTRNEEFDKNGYLVLKDLWDPEELYHPVPRVRGQYNYFDNNPEHFTHTPVEGQVEGSIARYYHPQYRHVHSGVRLKLEKVIGRKLYNTYYYDRYYFPDQILSNHLDRDACEISVSIHVSNNLPSPYCDWPINVKSCDTYTDETKQSVSVPGDANSIVLDPGDAVIYKGCERPHWRDFMPAPEPRKRDWFLKKMGRYEEIEYFYHQIFFHYVLQDGQRAHCAWDSAR